jgi:predicted phage tail component-like protein
MLPVSIGSQEVAGRDGTVYTGRQVTARTVTVTLTIIGRTLAERRAAERELASILSVDEPKPLQLSVDNGLYYMAMPSSDSEGAIYSNASSFDVEFVVHDPAMLGLSQTVSVPSGGSATFYVGGTYRTPVTVAVTGASNGSSGGWKLTDEHGDYLLVVLSSSGSTIAADCESRVLKVNGVTALLPPEADWLVLEPGQHTLTMNGSGTAQVTFTERWL